MFLFIQCNRWDFLSTPNIKYFLIMSVHFIFQSLIKLLKLCFSKTETRLLANFSRTVSSIRTNDFLEERSFVYLSNNISFVLYHHSTEFFLNFIVDTSPTNTKGISQLPLLLFLRMLLFFTVASQFLNNFISFYFQINRPQALLLIFILLQSKWNFSFKIFIFRSRDCKRLNFFHIGYWITF